MVKKAPRNMIDTVKNTYINKKVKFDAPLSKTSLLFCKNLIVEGYIEYVSIDCSKKSVEIKLKSTFNNISALHTHDSPTNLKIIKKNKIPVNPFAITLVAKTSNKYIEKLIEIR